MKALDISKYKLFEPILDFKIGNEFIDLHNDFNCVDISEYRDKHYIVLFFNSISNDNKKITIRFDNAEIANTKYELKDKAKYITLCNFHRGKFEKSNSTLIDKNENGQKYFYLDFFEGQHIEILAKRAIAEPNSKP